jgi:hypothetical protein
MSENKGCGCGKKNVAPAPPPETPAQPENTQETTFRSGEIIENGVKKN